jgi:hypothetical protein
MILSKVYPRFLMECNLSLVAFLTLIKPPVLSE